MKDRHWNSLVESLRNGRCVLVLGPEVAADWSESGRAAIPGSTTFAGALTEWLAEELKEVSNNPSIVRSLPAIAQLYEDAEAQGFGAEKLHTQAAQFYTSLRLKPSKDHEAIASLPFPLVISTCHDQLLTDALIEAKKPPLVTRYHYRGGDDDENNKIPRPTPSIPVVYHLFGTSQEAQSLVLSENDLLDFVVAMVSDRPKVPSWLRKELVIPGTSLLFVGFGISYWYQRVLVKALIRFLSGGRSRKIGAIALDPQLQAVSDPERTQTILFYERGHRVEVSDFDISKFFSDLKEKFDKAGGLTEKASRVRRPRIFISYVREDATLAAAVFDTLSRLGLEPWMDTKRLKAGDEWDEKVKETIRAVDFCLVLVTPEMARTTEGYINTEITLALGRRAEFGDFVIPLISDGLAPEERVQKLKNLNEQPFREKYLDIDLASLASQLCRDVQLRDR